MLLGRKLRRIVWEGGSFFQSRLLLLISIRLIDVLGVGGGILRRRGIFGSEIVVGGGIHVLSNCEIYN